MCWLEILQRHLQQLVKNIGQEVMMKLGGVDFELINILSVFKDMNDSIQGKNREEGRWQKTLENNIRECMEEERVKTWNRKKYNNKAFNTFKYLIA